MATEPRDSPQLEELRRVLLRPDALADRISPLIADILADQISTSRDDIARAIAPVIGEAIRRQVYQAREDIIDALYPVIGQMIAKAVTESLRELAQKIDGQLRQGFQLAFDLDYWRARLRGVSSNEYRLRDALPFEVREIFLIQRDTGLLICHRSADEEQPDRDLVSGMLTAIRDFAREAFGRDESGELGAITYETRQILIEAAGAAYLAVVIEGVEPQHFRQTMRDALVAVHEKRYDDLRLFDGGNQSLVELAGRTLSQRLQLGAKAKARQTSAFTQRLILGGLIGLIMLPFIICGGWIWRVEASFAALSAPPPTATATPSPYDGVMIGNVYLYSMPDEASARSKIVAPLGAPIEVLAQLGDWYRVRVSLNTGQAVELVGWVPSRWVSLLRPVAPERVTPVTGS